MKPTEFWAWSLRNLESRGRYVMRGKYRPDEAMRYWPNRDPQKVPGSMEIRNLPETDEEVLMNTPGAWRNYPPASPRNAQATPG